MAVLHPKQGVSDASIYKWKVRVAGVDVPTLSD